jgi:hypothetical protein
VPKSSIERITSAWGRVPTLNWIRKRSWLKIECWKRIFSATSAGEPTRLAARLEGGAAHRRPAALAADPVHHPGEGGEGDVGGFLRGGREEAVRVDAEGRRGSTDLGRRPGVQLGERLEAGRFAADDRQRHRQAEPAGADRRLG